MAQPVARLGDSSSHGGSIVTSASKTLVEGQLVARVGDMLNCPTHGLSPIITGSSNLPVEGKQAARTGSVCACGAVIIGGAKKTVCS